MRIAQIYNLPYEQARTLTFAFVAKGIPARFVSYVKASVGRYVVSVRQRK